MTIFNAPPRKMAGVPRGRVTQNLVRVNGQVAEIGDSFHFRRLINIAPGIDPNDAIIKDQFDPVDKRTQFRLISSSGSITLSDAGSPLNGMTIPDYYNYIGELPDGRKCGLSLLYAPSTTKLSGNVYTNWVASESVVFAIVGQSGSHNVNINPSTTHTGAEYFEWNSAPTDFAPFFQITVA